MSVALVFGLHENNYYNCWSIGEKNIGYGAKEVWVCSNFFSPTIHLQI